MGINEERNKIGRRESRSRRPSATVNKLQERTEKQPSRTGATVNKLQDWEERRRIYRVQERSKQGSIFFSGARPFLLWRVLFFSARFLFFSARFSSLLFFSARASLSSRARQFLLRARDFSRPPFFPRAPSMPTPPPWLLGARNRRGIAPRHRLGAPNA
jgi:hypothetical protein